MLRYGRMRALLTAVAAIPPGAPPGRHWLDRLEGVVPGPAATRWLLLADMAVLVLVGVRHRPRVLGALVAVGVGFVALNVLGMLLTDFFLGLAVFHVATGVAGVVAAGAARWAGAALLGLALALGALT